MQKLQKFMGVMKSAPLRSASSTWLTHRWLHFSMVNIDSCTFHWSTLMDALFFGLTLMAVLFQPETLTVDVNTCYNALNVTMEVIGVMSTHCTQWSQNNANNNVLKSLSYLCNVGNISCQIIYAI